VCTGVLPRMAWGSELAGIAGGTVRRQPWRGLVFFGLSSRPTAAACCLLLLLA
jgi:hypothetical protein